MTSEDVLTTASRCSKGGIGHALALEFHRRGLRVFPTARKAESLADLAAMGMEPMSLVVDDPKSVRECYKQIETLVGGRGLDYIFNNAGRSESCSTCHAAPC